MATLNRDAYRAQALEMLMSVASQAVEAQQAIRDGRLLDAADLLEDIETDHRRAVNCVNQLSFLDRE